MGNVTSFAFVSDDKDSLERFQHVVGGLTQAQVSESGVAINCDVYYMISRCDIQQRDNYYYLAGSSKFANLAPGSSEFETITRFCEATGVVGCAREEASQSVMLSGPDSNNNSIMHTFASYMEAVEESRYSQAMDSMIRESSKEPVKSRDELMAESNPAHHSTSSGVVVLSNTRVFDREYGFSAWVPVHSRAGNKTHVNVPLPDSYVGLEPMAPGTSRTTDLVVGLDDALHGYGKSGKYSYNKTFSGRDLQEWLNLDVYPDWPPIPGGGGGNGGRGDGDCGGGGGSSSVPASASIDEQDSSGPSKNDIEQQRWQRELEHALELKLEPDSKPEPEPEPEPGLIITPGSVPLPKPQEDLIFSDDSTPLVDISDLDWSSFDDYVSEIGQAGSGMSSDSPAYIGDPAVVEAKDEPVAPMNDLLDEPESIDDDFGLGF